MATTNKRAPFPAVDVNLTNEQVHRQKMAGAINGLLQGKSNNVLDVTLTPNSTTTVITDSRLSSQSHLALTPVTADALIAFKAGVFPSIRGKGTCTLTHAAAAALDQQFTMEITG